MKKLLIALCMASVLTVSVHAQDTNTPPKKPMMTPEQKAIQKEMLDKYDENKDGKLSKDERAKMTDEDKAKMEKAGLGRKKKDTVAPPASTM
ncbi:MAG TPA: hypothetical protein VH255_00320 [Verrucomicrobiae bacterium]|jgi:hypothetical protein|nr:hypothetical protein [Verrucomicrobiae bacterium]